jgi:hypothetical protein
MTAEIRAAEAPRAVFLHRRHQRLDDEDVLLATVGVELDLEAIVAESADPGVVQGQVEMIAYLLRQICVRIATENPDSPHDGGFPSGPTGPIHSRSPIFAPRGDGGMIACALSFRLPCSVGPGCGCGWLGPEARRPTPRSGQAFMGIRRARKRRFMRERVCGMSR